MSERFEIKIIDRQLHVIDTEMDDTVVYVTYSVLDAAAYVHEHPDRPSLAERDRIARMLAECAEVRETAERQIAEFTEIRDRAVSVERRLRARLNPLSGPVSARDGAGVPEVGPEAPRAFLSDLRQYATVQQMNAAHEYGASRTQLSQPVLLYKPMPY